MEHKLWTHVMYPVTGQVRDQIGYPVRSQTYDQVWTHVWLQVWTQVNSQVVENSHET